MQTSAINCSLSLKADKSEKSPEDLIILAASAMSFISFRIALCQCNISSIGWLRPLEVDGKNFRFSAIEDLQGQGLFSLALIKLLAISSSQLLRFLLIFMPSIQVNITFIKRILSQQWYNMMKDFSLSLRKSTHLLKKFFLRDYSVQAFTHVLTLIRWNGGRKPWKEFCHHINRNAA